MPLRRWAALLALLSPAAAFSAPPASFLETHCYTCHGGGQRAGGFDAEAIANTLDDPTRTAQWARVYERVQSGEMPPAKRPRPEAPAQAEFLRKINDSIAKREVQRDAIEGRATIRRLNRTEYENTLRDLLDLPGLNVKDLLPEDGRADGYDRSARALDISPILLAKYAEAADAALDAAIAPYSVPPPVHKERMYANEQYDFGVVIPNGDGVMIRDFKYDDRRFPIPENAYAGGKYPGLGELERSGVWRELPGTAGMFRCAGEAFQGRFNRFAPWFAGRYRITTSVWSFWWQQGEVKPSPRTQAAAIYFGSRALGFFDAPSLKPTTHQIETWLGTDDYLKFDAASLWEVHPFHLQGKAAKFIGPAVAIDYLEVEGPLHDQWPPRSHRRLFGDLPMIPFSELPVELVKPKRPVLKRTNAFAASNSPGTLIHGTVHPNAPAAEAEKLIRDFLPRAFRRPVRADEIARYLHIITGRLAAGECFENAMRAGYKAALCSPDFLFLREPVGPLDDYALAARLSYFLWNSLPDDALTRAAEHGVLNRPDELRRQVERMLADAKSDRFIRDFLEQWLDLRDLDATTPDRRLYPEYTAYLRDAIQGEPFAYFRQLLKDDRTSEHIITSTFVMLNQRLAEHYGIPGVDGTRFRAVTLPNGSHRGGFITQAAILKVTANGTTTTPVKRGAWVMRKLLGNPPQPPPPDIAAVEPDVKGATTIREQLAMHRDQAVCASCHAKMDPPGFALESFDVIGSYRERYRATEGKQRADFDATFIAHRNPEGKFPTNIYFPSFTLGQSIDPSGETHQGKKFTDIDTYRAVVLADRRALSRNYAQQLLTYATGVPVRFADRALLEEAINRAGGDDVRMRSMIHEIVQSPLFRNK